MKISLLMVLITTAGVSSAAQPVPVHAQIAIVGSLLPGEDMETRSGIFPIIQLDDLGVPSQEILPVIGQPCEDQPNAQWVVIAIEGAVPGQRIDVGDGFRSYTTLTYESPEATFVATTPDSCLPNLLLTHIAGGPVVWIERNTACFWTEPTCTAP